MYWKQWWIHAFELLDNVLLRWKMLRRVGSSYVVLCSCLNICLARWSLQHNHSNLQPTVLFFLFVIFSASAEHHGIEFMGMNCSFLLVCRLVGLVAWAFFLQLLASFLLLLKGSYSHNRCDFTPYCIIRLILCATVKKQTNRVFKSQSFRIVNISIAVKLKSCITA